VTVLSLTALCRLAERHVGEAGDSVEIEQLVTLLNCIDDERARAGIRLATFVGRLERTTDDEGRACVRLPAARGEAA
jgi:hypothetical protein